MAALSEFTLGKREKKGISISVLVLSLIVLAVGLSQISQRTTSPLINRSTAIFRSFIYFGLFIAWGLYVRRRVMQKQVRTYLTAISLLMVFWLLLRTVKYFFVMENLSFFRYLWYAYYIPELLIILMSLFIALSMGKPEDYRLPKWTRIFYIPTLILIGLVLTNDYHQMVFVFSGGIIRNNVEYKHNIVFWIVFAWLIICALIALVVMLTKTKVPRSKKIIWLPFVPLLAAIVYTFIYVFWFPVIEIFANDMTIVLCLLIMSIFESCIYTGLIRSNRHYVRLFYASSIAALIVDKNYNICFKSKGARSLSVETLKSAENGPIGLDGNTRLSGLPITGGHALWLEDVSEMNRLLSQLKKVGEKLSKNNELLQAELELKERQAVEEKDRLYDKVIKGVGTQLQVLENFLSESHEQKTTEKEKLMWLCILGAYIKRRSNLIILSEDCGTLFAKELEYSFRESTEAISECGIDCFFKRNSEGSILTVYALLIYDIFQEIVELVLPTLEALFINLEIIDENIKLNLQISYQGKTVVVDKLRNFNKLNRLGGYIKENWEEDTLHISTGISKEVGSHD